LVSARYPRFPDPEFDESKRLVRGRRGGVHIRKKLAALVVAFGAALTIVAPALPFTIINPVTGECRQVLVPGPATFPGNWEVVSATPAAGRAPGTATGMRTRTLRSGR
jgi:hypothetical protein